MKKIISWLDVHGIHKTVAGIFVTAGVAQSILINTSNGSQYPNVVKGKEITYCLGSATQPHGIKAMLNVVGKKAKIHVFQKMAVNEWVDLGFWSPVEVKEEQNGYWPIRMIPV